MKLTRFVALLLLCMAGEARPQSQAPAWRYGDHPLFGLSAHISVGAHSVGLRCLPDRGFQYPAAALMFSPGLVQQAGAAANASGSEGNVRYKFLGSPDWAHALIPFVRRGYYESTGSTCDVSLEAFKKGRTLLFFNDGDISALDDRRAEQSQSIIARIPLGGAASAIRELERACPAIRKDIANKCGI